MVSFQRMDHRRCCLVSRAGTSITSGYPHGHTSNRYRAPLSNKPAQSNIPVKHPSHVLYFQPTLFIPLLHPFLLATPPPILPLPYQLIPSLVHPFPSLSPTVYSDYQRNRYHLLHLCNFFACHGTVQCPVRFHQSSK